MNLSVIRCLKTSFKKNYTAKCVGDVFCCFFDGVIRKWSSKVSRGRKSLLKKVLIEIKRKKKPWGGGEYERKVVKVEK